MPLHLKYQIKIECLMKNVLQVLSTLIIVCFIATPGKAINQYYTGDTLYVWAKSGLNFRLKPELKAKKVATIPYGTPLIALRNSNSCMNAKSVRVVRSMIVHYEKMPSLHLEGRWLEVTYNKQKGYVFDGFLSRLPTLILDDENAAAIESFNDYAKRVFGLLKEETRKNQDNEFGPVTSTYHSNVIHKNYGYYENIVLGSSSMNEAYLLFNVLFDFEQLSNDSESEMDQHCRIIEKKEQVWLFSFDEFGSQARITQVGDWVIIQIEYESGC